MRKILAIAISIVVAAGLGLGVFLIVKNSRKAEKHDVLISTTTGGEVSFDISNKTYTVPGVYKVEHKSSIKLTAIPNAQYSFVDWSVNGKSFGSDEVLVLKIESDTTIKANFEIASYNLTILDSADSNFSETKELTASNNLLDFLNTTYTAPNGYYYSYTCDGKAVTENTIIYEDSTITRTKNIINYSIVFKNGSEVVETKTYTVEEQNVTAPSLPEIENQEYYTLSWSEYSLFSSKEIVVDLVKTAKEYVVTYALPEGFTFDGTNATKEVTYTIENVGSTTAPELPAKEHYTLAWENSVTKDNLSTMTINAVATPIEYVVTYVLPEGSTFEGTTDSTKQVVYTIETVDSISAPVLNEVTKPHYELAWEVEVTKENLATMTINAVETPVKYKAYYIIMDDCVEKGLTFIGSDQESSLVEYTIEDSAIEAPQTNVPKHYELTWGNYTLTYESTPVLIGSILTAKEYVVTYALPEGYTFDGTNATKDVAYTIETIGSISAPELPTKAHYTFAWEKVVTEENLATMTINAVATPIEYTVTFKNGEEVVGTRTYNYEVREITAPELPTIEGYVCNWETYDLNSLTDLTVNLVKEAITYYATFIHKGTEVAKLPFTVENKSVVTPANPTNDADYVYVWNKYTLELKDVTIESKALRIHSLNYTIQRGDINNRYQKVAVDAEREVVYIIALNNTLEKVITLYDFSYDLIRNSTEDLDLRIGGIIYRATSVNDLSLRLISVLSSNDKLTMFLHYEEN